MRKLTLIALLTLPGCASMERASDWCGEKGPVWPTITGALVAVAVGSVAMAASHSGPRTTQLAPTAPISVPAPCTSCGQ